MAGRVLTSIDRVDRRVSARLVMRSRTDGRPRHWVVVVRRFSEAGSYGIGWIVLFALVGVLEDGIARGAVAGACVVAMLVANTLVKQVIRRPRPVLRATDHTPTTFSMPSAHTSMAMVGAATMGEIMPAYAALWWVLAAALALSRVMLGVHYLGDILAGTALGVVVGLLVAAPLVAAVG